VRLSQECQTSFCDMSMFALRNTILLRGVRAGESVKDAMIVSELLEGHRHIFSSIVSLELFNGAGKDVFNKSFKFHKTGKNIRFLSQWVEPCKPGVVIYKQDIEFAATLRQDGGGPHIRVY
jgi:hypothetical protein